MVEPQLLSFNVRLFMAIGTALGAEEQFRKVAELDTRVVGQPDCDDGWADDTGADLDHHSKMALVVVAGSVGAAAVDSAIAHGVLSADDDGLLRFAIPSLHAYMLEHELRRGERQQQAT